MRYAIAAALVLSGCTAEPERWTSCKSDSDCAAGEMCPAMTRVCSTACSAYDDCYQMGLDAVCFAFPDGSACAFNCPKSPGPIDDQFSCVEYDLGYTVASRR